MTYCYDYDGGNVLAERRVPDYSPTPPVKDRYLSSYVWGPLGLIGRIAEQENSCPDDDCAMYYLNDATGNCVGVVCGSTTGVCSTQPVGGGLVQWTRMDAFGNLIAEIFRHEEDETSPLPAAVLDCSDANTACASTQPSTLDKPQVIAGPYQYHGSQGYEADVVMPTSEQASPGPTRSTNFMHVGVRYYEPATGRFLEHDPLPVDPTPFSWGQHNRWVYCANDPVNMRDAGGLASTYLGAFAKFIAGTVLLGIAVAFLTEPGGTAFFGDLVSLAFLGLGLMLSAIADILQIECNMKYAKLFRGLASLAFAISALISAGQLASAWKMMNEFHRAVNIGELILDVVEIADNYF